MLDCCFIFILIYITIDKYIVQLMHTAHCVVLVERYTCQPCWPRLELLNSKLIVQRLNMNNKVLNENYLREIAVNMAFTELSYK